VEHQDQPARTRRPRALRSKAALVTLWRSGRDGAALTTRGACFALTRTQASLGSQPRPRFSVFVGLQAAARRFTRRVQTGSLPEVVAVLLGVRCVEAAYLSLGQFEIAYYLLDGDGRLDLGHVQEKAVVAQYREYLLRVLRQCEEPPDVSSSVLGLSDDPHPLHGPDGSWGAVPDFGHLQHPPALADRRRGPCRARERRLPSATGGPPTPPPPPKAKVLVETRPRHAAAGGSSRSQTA